MVSEQRKIEIKNQILYYFDQFEHWHDLYMRDDNEGDEEDHYREKSKYFRKIYQNMIAEYFNFDYNVILRYSGQSRENVMNFLKEN